MAKTKGGRSQAAIERHEQRKLEWAENEATRARVAAQKAAEKERQQGAARARKLAEKNEDQLRRVLRASQSHDLLGRPYEEDDAR